MRKESLISNPRQLRAARAAQKALSEGKDPFAAAQEAAGLDDSPKPAPPAVDTNNVRLYALAVCRLGHGRFEALSTEQLLDVMCVVPVHFNSYEVWLQSREAK